MWHGDWSLKDAGAGKLVTEVQMSRIKTKVAPRSIETAVQPCNPTSYPFLIILGGKSLKMGQMRKNPLPVALRTSREAKELSFGE